MPTERQELEARTAIDHAVASFDGTHIAPLGEVAAETPVSPGILDHLLGLCFQSDENVQIAASWLLKHYLEHGANLTDSQNAQIADGLPLLTHWQAQLHLAQSFTWIACAGDRSVAVADILKSWCTSDRKFLRAWACDALWRLSAKHDHLHQLAIDTLLAAEADPAASVRARARNLLKLK